MIYHILSIDSPLLTIINHRFTIFRHSHVTSDIAWLFFQRPKKTFARHLVPLLLGAVKNPVVKWCGYIGYRGTELMWVCLKMSLVSLNPMVLLIIIPMKNGYFIGNINPTFSDKPMSRKAVGDTILYWSTWSWSQHESMISMISIAGERLVTVGLGSEKWAKPAVSQIR